MPCVNQKTVDCFNQNTLTCVPGTQCVLGGRREHRYRVLGRLVWPEGYTPFWQAPRVDYTRELARERLQVRCKIIGLRCFYVLIHIADFPEPLQISL